MCGGSENKTKKRIDAEKKSPPYAGTGGKRRRRLLGAIIIIIITKRYLHSPVELGEAGRRKENKKKNQGRLTVSSLGNGRAERASINDSVGSV